MNPWGGSAAGYGGAQNRVGNVNQGQAKPAQENGAALDAEQLLFLAGGQDNAFDDDVDEQPVQDLALNVDNVFQADDCDAFDSDVDEAPTAQTMFMANLSYADPVTYEAGPSYDSDILSKVPDQELYQDAACAHHEGHVMYDSVQLDLVVDSHADYTIDSNMILYDQYVKDNEVPVVHSDASSVSTDAFMMIYNDIPRPHYNELNKVAIGYKNPLYLTRAKQIQPTLYNGHEIIKDNHTPAIVHNAEDTLEIAEITRKKMNAKMNDPKCVSRKVKIAPHDYSKENFLATFTPEKQQTLEQIFWSNDLMKLKSDVLKDGPRKYDAIERKNLLITNDNLIVECLSQEVFFVATNSKLNVARFTEMHVANTTIDARCLALEAKLANLHDTNNHDNQKELINHFSKLKVSHLNLQLKYQNLKDNIGNNPPTPDKDTPNFDSVFVIGKMQASLQGKDNIIRQLKKAENYKIKQHYKEFYDSIKIIRAKHIEKVTKLTTDNMNLKTSVNKDQIKPPVLTREKHAIDVEPIVPRLSNNKDAHLDYLRHLKESVETIRDIVEEAKLVRPLDRSIVSACHYTKHSQELLEYAIDTCLQGSQQRAKQLAYIPFIRKKQVAVANPSDKSGSTTHRHVVTVKSQQTNVHVPPSTGVNSFPNASG
nr:hypothetical protein [Tanacetum cinerariifolium]